MIYFDLWDLDVGRVGLGVWRLACDNKVDILFFFSFLLVSVNDYLGVQSSSWRIFGTYSCL